MHSNQHPSTSQFPTSINLAELGTVLGGGKGPGDGIKPPSNETIGCALGGVVGGVAGLLGGPAASIALGGAGCLAGATIANNPRPPVNTNGYVHGSGRKANP